MTMRKYDLNLLTVLDALLRHRNVTQAGQELGLTQSATSHALLRLREQFGDKLLIQSGRTMKLTHRAEALIAPVSDLLRNAQHIFDTRKFEPETSIRRFKIGIGDYVALLLLPKLLNFLEQSAPNITLQVTWAGQGMASKLKLRELDLVISPRTTNEEFLHSELFFTDELVIIASKSHPEISDDINLEDFLRLPYAAFRNETADVSFAELQVSHLHSAPRETVLVPSFLLLPYIVASTSYISIIQRRLAEVMAQQVAIKILTPPFEVMPMHVSAFWSHEAHSDPAHTWLRTEISRICATL